jgi:transcriptional regulator with XRE-family HTH domain
MEPADRARREEGYGSRLRRWRDESRLTQDKLGEQLGYDVSYIRKIEGGTRPPTRAFLSRISLLAGPTLDDEAPRSLGDVGRSTLPQAPDPLIGRDDSVENISAKLLGDARLVTLLGPPGIGKTRLAMAVAARLDEVLRDGAWWVPLVDVRGASGVVDQALRTLGLTASAPDDASDASAG